MTRREFLRVAAVGGLVAVGAPFTIRDPGIRGTYRMQHGVGVDGKMTIWVEQRSLFRRWKTCFGPVLYEELWS